MEFRRILGRQEEVAAAYFAALQDANDARQRERAAATAVQSGWRMVVVRSRYHDVLWATRQIQRYSRGHLGKTRAQVVLLDRHRARNGHFFHHCAAVVQRHFRGYWSRKFWHHMKARRAYLDSAAERGERTNTFLEKTYQERRVEAEANAEAKALSEFTGLASQLHHLVSTHQIAGIYNPPYSEVVPQAFNEPVEIHLRRSNQVRIAGSLRRPAHRNRSVPVATRLPPIGTADADPTSPRLVSKTAGVGRHRPIQGPFRTREEIALANARAYKHYRSLNCDGEYDAVRTHERLAAKISKMTWTAPDSFTWRKVAEKPVLGSGNAETEYQHRAVEFREDYTEVPQMGNRPPFYLGMPAGKLFHEYEDPNRYSTLQGGV